LGLDATGQAGTASELPMARSKDPPKPGPKHSAATAATKAARQARLAEEMRRNLQKRKAQQRAQRDRVKPD
jgi:hypothetical protein